MTRLARMCIAAIALAGCRPAAAPVLTSTEIQIFDDVPDAYQLVSLELRIEGRVIDRPTEIVRREGRYTWRGQLDLSHTLHAEAVAVFRADDGERKVSGTHSITSALGGTIVFYERSFQGTKTLQTSRFRPPLTASACAHPASGPLVGQTIKLRDRTTSKYRVDSLRLEIDGKPPVDDTAPLVVALAARQMPILGMKIASGCHTLELHATLVGGDTKKVVDERLAFRAREGSAITLTLNEGAADVLTVIAVLEN